jgi:hypothetical protein
MIGIDSTPAVSKVIGHLGKIELYEIYSDVDFKQQRDLINLTKLHVEKLELELLEMEIANRSTLEMASEQENA